MERNNTNKKEPFHLRQLRHMNSPMYSTAIFASRVRNPSVPIYTSINHLRRIRSNIFFKMRARKCPMIVFLAVGALLFYLLYIESPNSTVSVNTPPFKALVPFPIFDDPLRSNSTNHVSLVESVQENKEIDPLIPPPKASKNERINWFRRKLPEIEILNSTTKSKRFHGRVMELFNKDCSSQFFMVWLSPAKSFGPREILAVDTLFTTNPNACLAILSNSLDSPVGNTILKPLLDRGFNLQAITLDLPFLVKNTPAEAWLKKLKSGTMDPGSIPLFMNLSDLTRLAVLYKYGGIYLDTDIIFFNKMTGLRNAIGAQSINPETKRWTRLNNAVMVFDINHPLICEFLHEYATTFNGNRWGYNSPYLASRVIERLGNKPEYNLTIFPPDAFYPVKWIDIPRLFKKPATTREAKWVEKTVQDLSKGSYMIHLWNKITRKIKVEEGSVLHSLISSHCTVCANISKSHSSKH